MSSRFIALLSLVLAAELGLSGCTSDHPAGSGAANYPTRIVTVICPWAAGGGTDRVSRYWAAALEKELGKPCVVVNKTGGSGAVGHSAGAKARPDGHTLTMITFELSTMHRMGISSLTFADYECLLQVNADPAAIIVRQDAPWKDLSAFLQAIQQSGDQRLKMSGTARGGAWDLARAGLLLEAGVPLDAVIWVPKEGAAPSLVELLGGHLDAVCCSVPEAAAQIDAGQARVLAVMSAERLEEYPDVPTAREAGVDWVAVGWRGLALPKGTPPQIVDLLEEKCLSIAGSEEFREFMEANRFGVQVRGASEFREFLSEQDEMWKQVTEAAGYAKS